MYVNDYCIVKVFLDVLNTQEVILFVKVFVYFKVNLRGKVIKIENVLYEKIKVILVVSFVNVVSFVEGEDGMLVVLKQTP